MRRPVGTNILNELERKVKLIEPELDGCNVHLALFSRSGFTDNLIEISKELKDLLLLDLAAIMDRIGDNS